MPTPDRTSLTEIVAAARALLESGGAAAVTMQAVASRVGVRAPSLYKRVRDRDALLALVAQAPADDLADRLATAEPSFDAQARLFRAFAKAQPEGFRLMFATDGASEAMGRAAGPILALTRELVGEADALEAARLVSAWVIGFVQMELAGAFRLGGDVDAAFEYGLARLPRALG